MKITKKIIFNTVLYLIITVLVLTAGYGLWLYYQFTHLPEVNFPDCPKKMLWAHRGLHLDVPENSLAAFKQAATAGFYGVELDIFFHKKKGFIIEHSPYSKKQLVQNKYLSLKTAFNTLKHYELYYWLDLKNRNVSEKQAQLMAQSLKKIITEYNLQNKIFIETTEAVTLKRLTKNIQGITPVYWMQFDHKSLFSIRNFRIIKSIIKNRFPIISINGKKLTKTIQCIFGHMIIFSWGYNSAADIKSEKTKYIKVMLTDKNLSKEFPEMFKPVKK